MRKGLTRILGLGTIAGCAENVVQKKIKWEIPVHEALGYLTPEEYEAVHAPASKVA